MNGTELKAKRAALLSEADALTKVEGMDEKARSAAFDAKMAEVDAIDVKLRALEQPAPEVGITAEQRNEILATERTRVDGITNAVRVAGLDATVAADLVKRNVTIEDARAEIFAKMAARSNENPTNTHIAVGEDAKDKQQRGALNWLLVRSGMAKDVAKAEGVELRTLDPGEFRGMTMADIARDFLERAGRSVRGLDRMRMVGEALTLRGGTQSISDFANLLENLMNKVLQVQYAITPDTWRTFCNTSTATDFRAQNRYRWGNLSSLDTLTEKGEFKTKGLTDAEKATITVATKGNIVNISRQMIVNDDLNAFTRLPTMLGRAAALSIEVDVFALLAQNSGDGPTMSDSIALFHTSSHGANKTTGAALSAAAIDADRVAMAKQLDVNGVDYIDVRPAILVVPVGLGGQAKVINESQYDPDNISGASSKATMRPNVVAGLFRNVVDTPRITGTRRYLFADPSIAPVLEVAFLEGQQSPVLETRDSWGTDGAELKVRFDYGVAAVDYRGAVTNAGT